MTGLHEVLTVLASPVATVRERRGAEEVLDRLLGWVPGWLRKQFSKAPQEALEGALDHLKDQATVGTARYAGQSDRDAFAWSKRVARNWVISAWRKEQTRRRHAETLARMEASRAADDAREEGQERLVVRVVGLAHDLAVHDASSIEERDKSLRRMRLGLEVLFGRVTQRDQLRKYGYLSPADESDPDAVRRANQTLWAHRSRGRKELARVVAKLVALQRITDEEAAEFAVLARLRWPPAAPSTKPRRNDA